MSKYTITVALALLLLLLPAVSRAQSMRWPQTAVIAGNAADLISTELALRDPQLRESNPLMGNTRTKRVVVKTVGTAIQVIVVRTAGKKHPRLAKALGYGIGTFYGGLAAWNLKQLPKVNRPLYAR